MSIERYFRKPLEPSCHGERIYSFSCGGYPINRNPEKQRMGIINSVARMLTSENSPEVMERCVNINAESLNMDPADLLLLAENHIDSLIQNIPSEKE